MRKPEEGEARAGDADAGPRCRRGAERGGSGERGKGAEGDEP